jgi:hypothetical protein
LHSLRWKRVPGHEIDPGHKDGWVAWTFLNALREFLTSGVPRTSAASALAMQISVVAERALPMCIGPIPLEQNSSRPGTPEC